MADLNGMFKPVEAGFARWMIAFRDQWFVASTAAGDDWASRPIARAMAFVPGRMIDSVTEMLDAWRRNANDSTPGTSAFLPVVFLAVARDVNPLPPEDGRQMTRAMMTQVPGDSLERWFKLRTVQAAKRAQVVIIAAETATASDIAAQILYRNDDVEGQGFSYPVTFAGVTTSWPVRVKASDAFAQADGMDQNNLAVLHIDLELVATVPVFSAPAEGEANDGNAGVAGFPPAGLSVITSTVVPESASTAEELLPATILWGERDVT